MTTPDRVGPSDLRALLLEIREQRGALTPAILVEEATAPGHPLHTRFEWDDAVAGHQYRLHQAGELVRSVKIGYTAADGGLRQVRGFVSVTSGSTREAVYEPTEEVLMDPMTSRIMLNQMHREWRSLKARFDHLVEFRAMIEEDLRGRSA